MITQKHSRNGKETVSFLLRIPSSNSTRNEFIAAHNKLFENQGFMPFGKFGKPIPNTAKGILSAQKEANVLTYLFVAMRSGEKLQVFRAEISDIVPSFEAGSKMGLPAYYPERPSSLFMLSSPLVPSTLDGYEVASTKRDAIEALNITRTPMMYICEKAVQ